MASQALASAALEIEHAATGKKVQFLQIKMTGFSDTVTPSWTEENVYGRMDPIATYQGTTSQSQMKGRSWLYEKSADLCSSNTRPIRAPATPCLFQGHRFSKFSSRTTFDPAKDKLYFVI